MRSSVLHQNLIWAIVTLVLLRNSDFTGIDLQERFLQGQETATGSKIRPYNQSNIELAVPNLNGFAPRLLVFTGERFVVYNLKHNRTHYHDAHDFHDRPVTIVPILVHALLHNFPSRFAKGMPHFQLLFTDSDSLYSECVNNKYFCATHDWAPIFVFGSIMKDAAATFPSAQLMPVPPFVECIYKYKISGKRTCDWINTSQQSNVSIGQLKPTIIWRGSDFAFLFQYQMFRFQDLSNILGDDVANLTKQDVALRLFSNWNEIGPRWRAVALSLQTELGEHYPIWLDSKFTGSIRGLSKEALEHMTTIGVHVNSAHLNAEELSKYRYQIDLGGGGGTSWGGTLNKLGMPGALFHHETLAQNWFHNEMIPWKHCIPINWDLTDLRAKYDWAEANLDKISQISREATILSNYLRSADYMERVYQEFIVDHLSKAVKNYQVQYPTWEKAMNHYQEMGFKLEGLASCDETFCTTRADRAESASSFRKLRYVPVL